MFNMEPTFVVLACIGSLLLGFSIGIIVSVWYYQNVVNPVYEEQKGKDDEVRFDCEAL
jgi:hypothetical protein